MANLILPFETQKTSGGKAGGFLTDRAGPLWTWYFLSSAGPSRRPDRPPLAGRPAWLGESEQPLTGDRLADQTQGDLRALVGLGEHRGAGLDENVPAGELRALLGDVHIHDAAVGGFEVGLVDREDLGGEAQAALLSAVVGAHGGDGLDRIGDRVQIDRNDAADTGACIGEGADT